MEKTIIAVTVPNVITILMILLLGLFGLSVAWQLGLRSLMPKAPANNSAGY